MLGSEYNWLINLTYTPDGVPKIRRAGSGMFTLLIAAFCFFAIALHAGSPTEPAVPLNVRDYGAIGDGNVHSVKEWIKNGRYPSMSELRRACPFVRTDEWTVDEAAFELAKSKLPASGGTVYFPAGRYVAAHGSWTIKKNHVHLLGDGADRSILQTTAKINDALVLSGYRHVGWLNRVEQQFPFQPESGKPGDTGVKLTDPAWAADFKSGDLVFIRNGACRFDQDYGEFNEVTAVDDTGSLQFKSPLARNYSLERINWAGTVTTEFVMPKPEHRVTIATSSEPGNFQPSPGETITVGGQLFEVVVAGKASLQLKNPGRGNASPGVRIAAGSKIAKSRAIIKVTQSTRDFRAEKIQFAGHRKILNLSNSYEMEFVDCRFVRQPADADDLKSGLTIDGDGGRWARFNRCTLRAEPAWGMQFARSFGGVTFDSCTFENASVAFTEFAFDCEVTNCTFDFRGPTPEAVVVVGKSGGNFRITHNRISAENVAFVFDAQLDIQSQKHRGEGAFVIRDNTVITRGKTQVFRLSPDLSADLGNNSLTTQ